MSTPRKPKRVSKAVLTKLKQVSTPTITTQLMSNHGLNNVSLRNVLPIDSSFGRLPARHIHCATCHCARTSSRNSISIIPPI